MMEGLDLLKDIPGFKAIVRAILKSQIKHLVEQLSEHGGEEAMLFTASVSDGTFHHLGSTATKGFLDTRENIKSQFLGHCMKGAQDTEVPNENAASVEDTTSDKISLNTVANTSRRSGRSVTLPLRYISSPVAHKGVGETTGTEMNALQTSSSKEGSKVASPKKGRGKKSRKRPTATFTSETPLKRSAIAETSTSESPFKNSTISKTVTQALNVLSNETGLEGMDGSVKIENNFNDLDNTQMGESDSSGTLSLDLGLKPSLDTEVKDGPGKISESNELDHLVQDLKVKIEPVDDESADFEENADELNVGLNPEMVGDDSNTNATEPGPIANANTKLLQPSKLKIHQCPVCNYTTTKIFNFKRHLESHSTERRTETFTCEQCNTKFKSKLGLKGHIKAAHVQDGLEEPLQCPECTYSTRHNSNFKRHIATHSNYPKTDISLICEDCGFHFRSQNGLKRHRDKYHTSKGSVIPPLRRKKELSQCPICSYTTIQVSNFKRHMITHGVGSKPDVTYVCEQCGSNFKSKYGLKIHTDSIHEAKYKFHCHVCDKGYNTLWNFQGHLRSHDKGIRLTCDICGSKFRFMSSLIRHKRQGHSKPKERINEVHTCDQCNRTFGCITSLKDHKRGMHGGKTLQCDRCRKIFRWRSSLFYHQKSCKFDVWEADENLEDESANEEPESDTDQLDREIANYTMVDS